MALRSLSDPMMTIAEAAKYLNVSKSTVRRMIKDGQLPTITCRERCVRVPLSAVITLTEYSVEGVERGAR